MNGAFLRLAALATLSLLLSANARAARCAEPIDTGSPVLSNGFAFNLSNTRDNLSQIDSGNVAGLRLALTHAAVKSVEKRGAPAVTQQAIFFAAGLQVIAMNRATGCQYWAYSVPAITNPVLGNNAVRSSSVYYLNEGGSKPALVLAGDYYGNYYALDARTGTARWSKFLGTDHNFHMITGGVQVYGGKLFVPVASREVLLTVLESAADCCKTHGMLHALDPYTGQILWTYETAPTPTFNRWVGRYTPNGMSIWGTPAIDPARGTVYVGTGQNLTPPTTANEDAIVALDIDTGKPKWVFQGTAGDAWNAACEAPFKFLQANCVPGPPGGGDFDFGAPPILAHLQNGREAVIAGEKSGMLFSLDPDTGRLNWSRRLGAGGNLGGIHWGMSADSQRVYVGVSDVTADKFASLSLGEILKALLGNNLIEQSKNATPGVYAVDLASGNVVWERHPTHPYLDPKKGMIAIDSIFSAATSVTNDVVFAGSLDGVLHAYRSSDGAPLWSYDTVHSFTDVDGNAGNGGTIDSVGAVPAGADLLINSGYATFGGTNEFQAGPGNALFVFRLPGG
ncbi:MAG: PQQ-binding-like beta-propeller repeat protein [Nevskia sp.]|nr:PQQ-binding-like beta-propeller repeat protein [Nevskia sp.]